MKCSLSNNTLLFTFTVFLALFCILFTSNSKASCEHESDDCAPVSEWQFSVGLGVGAVSNPLHGGKDIPLVVVPSLRYYGEHVFFENNTLGYSFYENELFNFSVIAQLNRDAAYFKRWHPTNIFIDTLTSGFQADFIAASPEADNNILERDVRIRQQDIKKRKVALDGGLQFNWFINKKSQLQGKILHDVNNVYQGSNAQIAYLRKLKIEWLPNTLLHLTLGVNWLSGAHVNYYYGLDNQDKIPSYAYYQADSSINPFIKLSSRYRINSRWLFAVSYKREWLGKAIYQSPVVAEKRLESLFIGAVYEF